MKEYVPKKPTDIITEKDIEEAKAPPKLPSEIGVPVGTPEYGLGDKDTTAQEIEKPKHLRFEGMSGIRCPLCGKHFERMFSDGRQRVVLVCQRCQIGIQERDPMVGKWEEVMVKLDPAMLACPVCGAKMRFFCTSLRFMKARCPVPKCGCMMVLSEPDEPKEVKKTPDLLQ